MRRLPAFLLLSALGCSGFAPPTPEQLQTLGRFLSDEPTRVTSTRVRVRLSVDRSALAGEYDGILLVKFGDPAPMVRAQFFGDLGPKMIDLAARADRIVGFFPQSREAVDCALPREATPHPLVFMGASLVENFSRVTPGRILGIREEPDGWWLRLRPNTEGLDVQLFIDRAGSWTKRRFRWMYGLGWEEAWTSTRSCRITASGLSMEMIIDQQETEVPVDPAILELSLPADLRIVAGSRK